MQDFNSKQTHESQELKHRLIHEKPVWVEVGALYDYLAYDSFDTSSISVSKTLHAICRMFPTKYGKKDIAATVWLSYSGFQENSHGKLKPNRVSDALSWLRDRGLIEQKTIGRTVYRALSDKAIQLIESRVGEYDLPGKRVRLTRKAGLTYPDSGTNRDSDREKEIVVGSGGAESSAKTELGNKSPDKKATTTNLFRFYEDINKVTGPADSRQKNEPFKTALAKHGEEGFRYVLNELRRDGVRFVWEDPVEKTDLHYSCIETIFDGLLRDAKPG